MAEVVPYYNGMQKGQGYNTFLQQLCVEGAVDVTSQDPPSNPFTRDYSSELIEDYQKLTQSLNLSAGAAISGWGQSAQVDVAYLNRSEFENSTLTYQVKVEVQQQGSVTNKSSFNNISTNTPNETFGDRYINDFIRGGYFFARVSIITANKSYEEEVKQAAKVTFTMYGATGEVTNEVKTAMATLQKHSEVRIVIHESTGASRDGPAVSKTESAGSDLLAIKARADKFYDDAGAGKHNYIRFALLGKYTNISNFNNAFKPFDYSEANKRCWALFNDFTMYLAFEKLITDIPPDKYTNGSDQKSALQNERIDEVQKIRGRVAQIAADPDLSRAPPNYKPPSDFRKDVYRAIKTTLYIAQSVPTEGDDNWTDIALQSLASDGTKLFQFRAYDFGPMVGTSVVSFGKATDREAYICLIGERANSIQDWREQSKLWVFPEKVNGVAEQAVVVSRLASKNYVRLRAGDANDVANLGKYDLFYFYVASA